MSCRDTNSVTDIVYTFLLVHQVTDATHGGDRVISQRVHRAVSSEAQRDEDCRGSGTIEHVVYQRLEVVKR